MNRSTTQTQTQLRARPVTDALVGRSGSRMQGKVVLIDATDLDQGIAMAKRYSNEGADLAVAYRMPSEALYEMQELVEASGKRCVLYEIALDDEWNCGLVVQSTSECLGPIDLLVNGRGHVFTFGARAPLEAAELLELVAHPHAAVHQSPHAA